jgi:hypothetical protein
MSLRFVKYTALLLHVLLKIKYRFEQTQLIYENFEEFRKIFCTMCPEKSLPCKVTTSSSTDSVLDKNKCRKIYVPTEEILSGIGTNYKQI